MEKKCWDTGGDLKMVDNAIHRLPLRQWIASHPIKYKNLSVDAYS